MRTLPRIIAVDWKPELGQNQLDATVTNILGRIKKAKRVASSNTSKKATVVGPAGAKMNKGGAKTHPNRDQVLPFSSVYPGGHPNRTSRADPESLHDVEPDETLE